jgi:hypothetical protein
MGIKIEEDRRVLSHSGGVSGFTARNVVYPDDNAAVLVLTNSESEASKQIVKKIEPVLFLEQDKNMEERLALARKIFDDLQHRRLDRSLLTANCNDYFNQQAIEDFADSLSPLGVPEEFIQSSHSKRGGMGSRSYTAKFHNGKALLIVIRDMPNGKIEQFQVWESE